MLLYFKTRQVFMYLFVVSGGEANMGNSSMVNKHYSASMKAQVIAELRKAAHEYEIDFQNPNNDPKTKKFFAEQQLAMYFLICAAYWVILENAKVAMQEVQDRETMKKEDEKKLNLLKKNLWKV